MLYLIGLGLWNEKNLTLEGIEAAKECDVLYLEEYTSKLFGTNKQKLEEVLGKKIQVIPRNSVESGEILNYAKSNVIGLLIGGDPLTATTHTDLILQAKEKNIKTKIIHNSSIYTAIAETGLQIYKFGRATTVTFWTDNYKPTSFYEIIKENQKQGLHTLVFLDIDQEKQKYMSINEALSTLLECGLNKTQKVIGCARIGSEDQIIKYDTVEKLIEFDFGKPLHILIVPGKLHEKEEEFLNIFK